MPVTKADVLAVLEDPKLKNMHFSVGQITVNANEYYIVADYIRNGDIQVIPGQEPVAFYDGRRNTIETQAGNPPLNVADRAQILHECTHAIVDINGWDVLRLEDEAAAYLAQMAYSWTGPFPRAIPSPGTTPTNKLAIAVLQVVEKYDLHNAKGFGARIGEWDIVGLRRAVKAHPGYTHVREDEKSDAATLGVPVKNNQINALRGAIKRAQQRGGRPRAYSASPRMDIF
jgi:cytochrome c peroxidase